MNNTARRLVIGLPLLSLSLVGCRAVSADTATPAGRVIAVVASISSATLAEDCAPATGGGAGKAKEQYRKEDRARACDQTSVQLALATGAEGAPDVLTIVKAQLFDAGSGALLQEMTTRNPQIWTDSGIYQAWNRELRPNQKLKVSYDMNAPDWSKMGGSQRAARGRTFRLEVTLRLGGKDTRVSSVVRSAELMLDSSAKT